MEKRQLVALVADGCALPCVMPDIEVIARIVTYYERWQVPTFHSRPPCATLTCLSTRPPGFLVHRKRCPQHELALA